MRDFINEWIIYVCAMGTALFLTIAICIKLREFDDLRTQVRALEYEVSREQLLLLEIQDRTRSAGNPSKGEEA